jgi:cytochrome c oxidase subunit 3
VTIRYVNTQSRFALRYFVTCLAVFGAGGGLGYLLIHWARPGPVADRLVFPTAFWCSTVLLAAGSVWLHRALHHVRLERQRRFRRSLGLALAAGMAFVAVQSYALWCLLKTQDPADVATGVGAFVFVLAFLHGLHFSVALLFLAFVMLSALADRYDHEYYWGVTVCTYFWHVLVVAWSAILAVCAIAL